MLQNFVLTRSISLFLFFSLGFVTRSYAHPSPVVNFEINRFCFGDTTYFTNNTITSSIAEYLWIIYEFEDDNTINMVYTSNDSTIKFLFPHEGKYKIILNADNGHAVAIERLIFIDTEAHAYFEYSECGSQFSNLSVCYTNCQWDFGDGSTSSQSSPVHFYKKRGQYIVTLSVEANGKTSVYKKEIIISSLNDIDPDFSVKVLKDSVLFIAHDSLSDPYTEYHWSFGDRTVLNLNGLSGGRKVWHRFPDKEVNYTVFLLVKSVCFNAFKSKTIFIPDSTPVEGTSVFPNPLNENTLKIISGRKQELTKINVCAANGSVIGDFTISETTRGYDLGFSRLPEGIYFVHLYFPDEIIRHKILRVKFN